jgi:hypothetical protein
LNVFWYIVEFRLPYMRPIARRRTPNRIAAPIMSIIELIE